VRREVQSILLVLTGGALIRLSMSGTFVNFVKPRLGPYLILAGVVLVVLGLWGASRDDTPGRSHEHRGPRTAWLLLLPVLTIFLVAPPPLGSFAAGRGGNSVPQPASGDLPALKGDPADLDVVDFVVRAVWDDRETLPAMGEPGEAASVAQTQDFIASYQAATARPWGPSEVADAWAAGLWVRLFNARKDAADGGGPQLDGLESEVGERLALAALD